MIGTVEVPAGRDKGSALDSRAVGCYTHPLAELGHQPSSSPMFMLDRRRALLGSDGELHLNPLLSLRTQLDATRTVVSSLIEPLEARGNKVQLFLAPSTKICSKLPLLEEILGRHRVVASKGFDSPDQAASVRHALWVFLDAVGGRPGASNYDLVIFTRFDVRWRVPINFWRTPDYSTFNFLSPCLMGGPPQECTTDIAHTLPGKMVPKWSKVASKCFESRKRASSGHGCYGDAALAFGRKNVGLITTAWVQDYSAAIAGMST